MEIEVVAPVPCLLGGGCGANPGAPPALAATSARIGQSWTLTSSGFAPGAPGWIHASAGFITPVPLGPCILHLDFATPGNFALLASGAFGGAGSWAASLRVPSDPGLLGRLLSAQTLGINAGGPFGLELSNGVRIAIGL